MYKAKSVLLYLLLCGLFACKNALVVEAPLQSQVLKIPKRVLVYLDCSASNKGFFDDQIVETIGLIGNMNADLASQEVQIVFYKFDATSDTIAEDFSDFSRLALAKDFFQCTENHFSAPLENISTLKNSDDLILILTDGVISVNGGNLAREQAEIQNALTSFPAETSIGLFHFKQPFQGYYYPQPSDKPIKVDRTTRNFYCISIGDVSYNKFLNKIIIENNKPANFQFLGKPYNLFIDFETESVSSIVADNKFQLSLMLDYQALGTRFENIKDDFVIEQNGKVYDDVSITTEKDGENKLLLTIQTNTSNLEGDYELVLNHTTRISRAIQDLNYNVLEEPIVPNQIDHSKTYSLSIVLNAFEYLFKDQKVFSVPFSIKPSNNISVVGMLYPGETSAHCFLNGAYMSAFIILLGITLVSIFISIMPDEILSINFPDALLASAFNPWRSFLIIMLVQALLVTLFTFVACYLFCDQMYFQVPLFNGLWSLLSYGIIVFILVKVRVNSGINL